MENKKVSENVVMASRLHSILADWVEYTYREDMNEEEFKKLSKIDDEGHAWLDKHGNCK